MKIKYLREWEDIFAPDFDDLNASPEEVITKGIQDNFFESIYNFFRKFKINGIEDEDAVFAMLNSITDDLLNNYDYIHKLAVENDITAVAFNDQYADNYDLRVYDPKIYDEVFGVSYPLHIKPNFPLFLFMYLSKYFSIRNKEMGFEGRGDNEKRVRMELLKQNNLMIEDDVMFRVPLVFRAYENAGITKSTNGPKPTYKASRLGNKELINILKHTNIKDVEKELKHIESSLLGKYKFPIKLDIYFMYEKSKSWTHDPEFISYDAIKDAI